MTTATLNSGAGISHHPGTRPSLITRPLLLRFVSIIGSSVSFYLPLSVMPMFARASGASTGAGLVTGALLLSTVLVELMTPRLLARVGYRASLTAGLLLLGAPALALLASSASTVIIGVSIVRGAGFAVTTVAGGALTASLIPQERRGEGLGLVGIVGGIPALVALPAGVWVAAHWGFSPVFVATAAAALVALTVVPGYPGLDARPSRRPQEEGTSTHGRGHRQEQGGSARRSGAHGVLVRLRDPGLLRPAGVFSASTMAAGVLVTFLPLAVAGRSAWVATAALFAQPASSTLARWAVGRAGDRRGHAGLLVPGVVLSALGLVALAATASPVLIIAGATVFGAGFGLLQNASLALMYARVPADGHTAVSAIWNAAYDAGMGLGAIGMGLAVGAIGYPGVFVLTGLLTLTALLPASRERASERAAVRRRRSSAAASGGAFLEHSATSGTRRRHPDGRPDHLAGDRSYSGADPRSIGW
jgi:MFS family permease